MRYGTVVQIGEYLMLMLYCTFGMSHISDLGWAHHIVSLCAMMTVSLRAEGSVARGKR
jgi:hypothetical protein